jgi:hypothetical protein
MATCQTLFDVIYSGSCKGVETALSKKDVNILQLNDDGQAVIHLASGDDKVPFDVFKLVINKRKEGINFKNAVGNRPLHCACLARDLEKVRYLVKSGAQLEARNEIFETPLLVACKQQASEIVTYLLKKGANRDAADNDRNTIKTISNYFSSDDNLRAAIKTRKKLNFLERRLIGGNSKFGQEMCELRNQKEEMETKYHVALTQNTALEGQLNNLMNDMRIKHNAALSQNAAQVKQLNQLMNEMEEKCRNALAQNAAGGAT